METYIVDLADYLQQYIRDNSISFIRVDPHSFISMIYRMFTPFCSRLNEKDLIRMMKQKALYCLWNTVIDDTIEYTSEGKNAIKETLHVISCAQTKESSIKLETEAGLIMHDFVEKFLEFPLQPHTTLAKEMLFLDLVRIINGFDYERIIHEHTTIGTLSEYLEFSTATIDLRVFLDIDLAIYEDSLTLSTIGDLREAYHWFNTAIKLSSDIATFQREFFVEASQNAIILKGQQDGSIPRDILTAGNEYKTQFEANLPPLMNQIKKMGRTYLIKALDYLAKIEEVDTSEIARVFENSFEDYPGMKTFNYPDIRNEKK